jgi:hypothetical protein
MTRGAESCGGGSITDRSIDCSTNRDVVIIHLGRMNSGIATSASPQILLELSRAMRGTAANYDQVSTNHGMQEAGG